MEAEDALSEANALNNANADVWGYLALVCLHVSAQPGSCSHRPPDGAGGLLAGGSPPKECVVHLGGKNSLGTVAQKQCLSSL